MTVLGFHLHLMLENFEACKERIRDTYTKATYSLRRKLKSAGRSTNTESRIILKKSSDFRPVFFLVPAFPSSPVWPILFGSKNDWSHPIISGQCGVELCNIWRTQRCVIIMECVSWCSDKYLSILLKFGRHSPKCNSWACILLWTLKNENRSYAINLESS